MPLSNDPPSLWTWRVSQGCEHRDPKREHLNPSREWFVDQLGSRDNNSTILWNTYSFKDRPIGTTSPGCFGFTDEKIIFRFSNFYKHLAKTTGHTIKPFCFVGHPHSYKTGKPLHLHLHSIELWTPQNLEKFKDVHLTENWDFSKRKEPNPVMKRVDRIFRKHFPCEHYPKRMLTRGKSNRIIDSQTTQPEGGSVFYGRRGHNFVPFLNRTFYP